MKGLMLRDGASIMKLRRCPTDSPLFLLKVAWRGHLEIRSPFDELIWEGDLLFGEDNDVPANGSVRSENRMSTNNETEGFNVEDYQVKDMEFLWTKVQVRY